jgi:hypothetical protein
MARRGRQPESDSTTVADGAFLRGECRDGVEMDVILSLGMLTAPLEDFLPEDLRGDFLGDPFGDDGAGADFVGETGTALLAGSESTDDSSVSLPVEAISFFSFSSLASLRASLRSLEESFLNWRISARV